MEENAISIKNIKERIITAFSSIGIFIDLDDEDDIDLQQYLAESIQFIAAIIEIEKIFEIEFPDEMLLQENVQSLNVLADIIYELLTNKYRSISQSI